MSCANLLQSIQLCGLAGGDGGGPGPLEVIAAEPAGDVDDFADEVEAGDDAALQGAGVEGVGVDSADGDLGLGVAFGAGGCDTPIVQAAFDIEERGVGEGAGFGFRGVGAGVERAPAVGHTPGHDGTQSLSDGGEVAAGVGLGERCEDMQGGGLLRG